VKEGAEEKRWKDRGGDDEMMRAIWILEEKRRVERQRRETEGVVGNLGGEEDGEMSLDEIMADDIALREQMELEAALKDLHSADIGMGGAEMENGGDTPYGSDDEEYEDIFMNVVQEEMRSSQPMSLSQRQPDHVQIMENTNDMMDMS
jgi:hypothetical protein